MIRSNRKSSAAICEHNIGAGRTHSSIFCCLVQLRRLGHFKFWERGCTRSTPHNAICSACWNDNCHLYLFDHQFVIFHSFKHSRNFADECRRRGFLSSFLDESFQRFLRIFPIILNGATGCRD